MTTVLATWTVNGQQHKLELSNGEALFEWNEPYVSITDGVTHYIYRGAFTKRSTYYVFAFFAVTEPATVSEYYLNGSTWSKVSDKYTSPTQASNGLYYFTEQLSWDFQYNTRYITYYAFDSNANRYTEFDCIGEFFNIDSQANAEAYQAYIETEVQPPYNWQSVSSVSGRTGTLQLVTLDSESINSGEPVSGAAISVFNQQPTSENNIKDLADAYGSEEESSAVDVIVDYKVALPPGGIFSLLKLIAKKGSVPQDASDGDKIIDISPTKTKDTVTGLDENSTYYFKIFAEDSNGNTSESDEKHCSTGIRPIEPSNEVITVIAKAYSDGYQEKVTATKEEN